MSKPNSLLECTSNTFCMSFTENSQTYSATRARLGIESPTPIHSNLFFPRSSMI